MYTPGAIRAALPDFVRYGRQRRLQTGVSKYLPDSAEVEATSELARSEVPE
jgi:hypothetical protein